MIPRVIVEAEEYRVKVLENYISKQMEAEPPEHSENSTDSLLLNRKLGGVRLRTNYALMELYAEKGYDAFKKTCLRLKSTEGLTSEEYGIFKGELAEVYLYVTIAEFLKKFNLQWKLFPGLIIRKPEDEVGTTECDLVLVSEQMIVVFEAKSYNGDKEIVDLCTIKRKKDSTDIYRQNALHCRALLSHINGCNLSGKYGMKSALFSFASGGLSDSRTTANKQLMPVLTEHNLLSFLSSLSQLTQKFWKSEVFQVLERLVGQITREEHIAYVKSVKGNA